MMKMFHSMTVALSLCAAMLLPTLKADAQELTPAWHCLPAETIGMVQLPNARAFAEALEARTRLGQLLLDDERIEAVRDMLREQDPEGWQQMLDTMEKYQFSADDLPQLLDGPAGLAIVADPRRDAEPLMVLLGWVEPGEELAGRIVNAMQTSVEEMMDGEVDVRRVDFDVAGQRVMHLSLPEVGPSKEIDYSLPDNWEDMTEEEFQEHFRQQQEDIEWIVVDRTNLMVTQMGPRLLFAVTPPQAGESVREQVRDGDDVDWDRETGVENLTAVLARFLNAHDGGDGAFARRVLTTPGVEENLPREGEPFVEFFASAEAIKALDDVGPTDVDMAALLSRLGLDSVSAAAGRVVLAGQQLRYDMFVTAPSPRRGILAMLDQPTVAAEPPDWVASDVLVYNHFSIDLGDIYRRAREMIINEVGQPAEQTFAEIEMPVRGMLQTELDQVLSSLGQQHVMLSYGSEIVEVEVPDFERGFNEQTGEFHMTTEPMPQSRDAYVWRLRDEQVWQQIMQVIGQFAPQMGGMVQRAEEQGFSGYRMDAPGGPQLSLFLGQGHLVLTTGSGVAESVLSMLRNPPQGEAALRNDPRYVQASRLLSLRPGIAFTYSDMEQVADDAISTFLTTLELADLPGLQEIRQLLPEGESLEGALSVGVGQMYFSDDGLVMQNTLELPPGD